MKNLKNISVFKVIILSIFATYFNNIFIYACIILYLTFSDYYDLFVFVILVGIILLINNIKCDFIPIGIVDLSTDNYCIVDKFLYKVKILKTDALKIGDILIFEDKYSSNYYETELKKNILYYGYSYEKIGEIKARLFFYNLINQFDGQTKAILDKFMYNINDYDDLNFNIGFCLASYYSFRLIYRKNKNISLFLLIIYSLLFNFQVKYYLLVIDYILSKIKIDKKDTFSIKVLIIYLINNCLLINYSILLPLVLNLYQIIDFKVDFNVYLSLIESYLFGEIKLISSIFYKYFIYFQVIIFAFSFVLLAFPKIEPIYLKIIEIYSYFNDLNISIRGQISVIGIVLWMLIYRLFNINNQFIRYIFLICIILSPINKPFGSVDFIDVGQGDAILIRLPLNGGNVLIDTGSTYNYYKLKSYLFKQGIYKLDYLIITHNDSDHNGNIESLNCDFIINNIITEGQTFKFKNLNFINYDLGGFDNDNDNSLVYSVDINGLKYLFTGDISINTEKVFINKYGPIDVDVLKVSHHGSYTASSKYFISNILPEYAIISTSGQYNHPASSTIETLNDYLVKYFVTKTDKNIEFYYLFGLNIIKYDIANFVIIR